jgi:hypothetical protein
LIASSIILDPPFGFYDALLSVLDPVDLAVDLRPGLRHSLQLASTARSSSEPREAVRPVCVRRTSGKTASLASSNSFRRLLSFAPPAGHRDRRIDEISCESDISPSAYIGQYATCLRDVRCDECITQCLVECLSEL